MFGSAHQALMFAYTFSANQYGVTAAAERLIASFGRDRYERLEAVARGRGLRGLDGAAQAGMIKRIAEDLPALQHLAVEARFNVLARDRQNVAIGLMALGVRKQLGITDPTQLVVSLVGKHYGRDAEIEQLGENAGIPKRTMIRRWVEIRRKLREVDQRALDLVEDALAQRGVVQHA